SKMDVGWRGTGHGLPFPDGAVFALRVAECDSSCETCTLEGPVPVPPEFGYNNRRCTTDTSMVCESDDDCPAAENVALPKKCSYLLGLGLAFGPTCSFIEMAPRADGKPAVQGVIDFRTGDHGLSVNARILQAFGESCFECETTESGADDGGVGEDAGMDDPTGSVCRGGLRQGESCEVHGALAFGQAEPSFFSYDCPTAGDPSSELKVLLAEIVTQGVEWTLDQYRPFCTAEGRGSERCWCGLCSDEPLRACISDRECGGQATCGAGPPGTTGIATQPNACENWCEWNTSVQQGFCAGGGAESEKRCFPGALGSVIRAEGSVEHAGPGRFRASIAGIGCLAQGTDGAINAAFGIPGPLRVSVNVDVIAAQ
ncbi:MAG: hypothetical protein KC416_12865, partial [Myxococcales bacterium]|nr:hypothetical protein [Myxococcales bacterium]